MAKNHHGSLDKIPERILGADGQQMSEAVDEKTVINNFTPNKAMVLVKIRKESMLLLPDGKEDVCPYAVVIAVGPECRYVRVGETIMMAGGCRAWKIPYKGDDRNYLIVAEGDFFGFINRDENDPVACNCEHRSDNKHKKGCAYLEEFIPVGVGLR